MTLPPTIGRISQATQSTPPSREACVSFVSSPIFVKRLVISASNSPGVRSARFGRLSSVDITSALSMKRGSTMLNATIGRTGRSSCGLADSCALSAFWQLTGSAFERSMSRNAATSTLTVNKQGRISCPVAGSIESTKQLSTIESMVLACVALANVSSVRNARS